MMNKTTLLDKFGYFIGFYIGINVRPFITRKIFDEYKLK